jgi:DNA helicase HerA-like ATPase
VSDLDQLGSFYLGRRHDLAAGKTLPEPLLYDSGDLTTHAVCVGMTGSGKTGLCLALLEEAALDGIPAIAIDPKGDLGNLLLVIIELREKSRPSPMRVRWNKSLPRLDILFRDRMSCDCIHGCTPHAEGSLTNPSHAGL